VTNQSHLLAISKSSGAAFKVFESVSKSEGKVQDAD
jgi:hypothetical protein